ncbi:uncharacterized protein HMPREF1541_07771 [Cyphellophora europaea CBS 101466]|uniref:Zn(2)-C6 fungal-type domain-containing protein n=1 Tax=Cyphellophora europaea (strain CBS 101466) TaxID=1220924 RepID=W2RNU4_CYPE1|nr:uncharacterized protein HMPREF1541_07771 [Cyphellophora europaea CBS 101466]ETN38147.1 hypothetical protein HMPREF1541_07771 [Cyphellophora europaea CBS 101466]
MAEKGSASPSSSGPSPEEDRDQDQDVSSPEPSDQLSQHKASTAADSHGKPSVPMQKRRRVTRACDECRRKKIKCDGKQPCTHCTVYSYDCTYDQPSNRRRNPAPQYIEALEQRLQKSEAILQSVLPGIDLDDPKFDARGVDQIVESTRARLHARQPSAAKPQDDDGEIQPMVEQIGLLDLDDQGHWDFHGNSSGYAFMRKFRSQFGEQFLPIANPRVTSKARNIAQLLESPKSAQSSPYESTLPINVDLPTKEAAIELCRNTLDDCCALMRPLHRPTFFRRLHSIYETEPEQYSNEQMKFLPLLYIVIAVGFLFSETDTANSMLEIKGYGEAIEQGYRYLDASKQMLDITDCRDLITIQTIFFMILFLQSSAKLATCYAYIGIALRACCRLGLHRAIPNNKFNAIELEERKRIFWLVRKIDTYVGGMLGLPQMLSDEDIDQELPAEVHDECITEGGIQPIPPKSIPLMRATNSHTKLTFIYRKVVRYVYPIQKSASSSLNGSYTISHARIRELERDLQLWMDELPVELRPSDNAPIELSRVQQLLRMSYAHVQMMMYRPFIHYVSQACQNGVQKTDKRSFACAAACVSVARNIVHITTEMKRRGLLVGAYWFVMYTTFFAIISLVYFVLENPNSPTGADILKDALEGRETLASLAQRSMAADRCSESLASLFNELPEKLKERRNSSNPPSTSRKRGAPASESGLNNTPSRENTMTPNRARTLPHDYLAKVAQRNSMADPSEGISSISNPHLINLNSPVASSPMSAQPFDYPTQPLGQTQIPDLKNVMFPSDNPFAYPNQPISTLESADARYNSFPTDTTSSAMDSPFAGSNENSTSMLGTPVSIPSQPHLPMTSNPEQQRRAGPGHPQQLDMTTLQRLYEENPQLAAHLAQQQRQFAGQGIPQGFMQEQQAGGGHQQQPTQQMFGMQGAAGMPEDYWTQMGKAGVPTRTGFTPGGTVNLDELFGGGDGWGPGGMWEAQGFPRQ